MFAGIPEPALPSVRRLIESHRHDVIAVLTRPDAASGRRGKPSPSPVARLALEHDIPALRPARPNADDFVAVLTELAPDCVRWWPTARWCRRRRWRSSARLGQPALLAAAGLARRGAGADAAPHGDEITGASVFELEEGLDTGPVYGSLYRAIRPTDTAGDLLERLAVSGAS